jgi:hypothetical protein
MRPKLLDVSTTPPTELRPAAEADVNGCKLECEADLALRVGDVAYGPFRNPVFSPLRGLSGRPARVRDGDEVRYSAKLKSGLSGPSAAVLLSTPVLDDVTLYFDDGGPRILGWVCP